MPQLQHNMWVVAARTAVLSIITGGGKWVEIVAHADPLYQHLIVTAERKFWNLRRKLATSKPTYLNQRRATRCRTPRALYFSAHSCSHRARPLPLPIFSELPNSYPVYPPARMPSPNLDRRTVHRRLGTGLSYSGLMLILPTRFTWRLCSAWMAA